jgi:hypothetical protein
MAPASASPIDIIETGSLADEAALVARLIAAADLDAPARARITAAGADLVRQIRASVKPGLMEVFLAEYGLSTEEGIALMCLAEALLRVPDAETMDALIEDKIAPSDWGRHLGRSASSLVNASTWALMLTGKVLEDREPGRGGPSARRRQTSGRTRDPHRRQPRDEGNGPPVRAGRNHRGGAETRARTRIEGLHLQLRHAGRGGPHRGRRPALSPVLHPRDHRHRRGLHLEGHPRKPRHFGETLGPASAVRGGQARPA